MDEELTNVFERIDKKPMGSDSIDFEIIWC